MSLHSRREFLKRGATAGAGAALGFPMVRGKSSGRLKKPDLLFILTDQQRYETLAAYGNPVVRAPALNRLAGESLVIDRCYASQPVCTPARSTLQTGLWPHQTGCTGNNLPLSTEAACFPDLLDDADYRFGHIGKWHLGDEVFAQHGYGFWSSTEDGYWSHFSEGRDPHQRSDYHRFLREAGFYPDGPKDTFTRETACGLPAPYRKPAFMAAEALRFLKECGRDPFVLWLSFLEPHTPFISPRQEHYPPEALTLPSTFATERDPSEPLRYQLRRDFGRQAARKGSDKHAVTEAQAKTLMARYFGLIEEVDLAVGRVLAGLEAQNRLESTVIVFTSDHGEMMGAQGLFLKEVMYEPSIRVPLTLRVPGLRAGRAGGQMSQVDLVPTLLDLLGGRPEVNSTLAGKSRWTELQGHGLKPRPVFVEWNPNTSDIKNPKVPPAGLVEEADWYQRESSRSVLTPDGYKLTLSDRDRPQFFHLAKDPEETRNLVGEASCRPALRAAWEQLEAWQQATGDAVPLREANARLLG